MYPIATTHRAAILTWGQRDILFDLWKHDKRRLESVTGWEIAQRLHRSGTSVMMSLAWLQKRELVASERIDTDKRKYIHSLAWFLTDDGFGAIHSLGE